MLEAVLIVLFSVQLSILSFRLLTLLPAPFRETLLKAAGLLFLGTLLTFFLLYESSFQWPDFSSRLPSYSLWAPS
ncbi:hypothetical protein ACSYAY_09400 [Leptospirillum ferriphilum]|uniref:Uncharacterized protein n=3 Tax=Leptospirillum ferriphilum TaxID=178606 RepID=A0A059Y2Z5_9BACT|nr:MULTISPECIES: hypothetical protein [Leptospirillum]AFS54040.1 hypothetical protein LFML04_1840 [Leptospirillum ferriphilum ML-04]AIA31862.1 hypothetical protein Y981_09175 [Leptospirillum ferriphilum YSK]AKS23957.1 hypothetical protein ABH19_09755 [Leptospirillum sp. Group II 'CF-1']KGA93269.1 hypothetical protein LptCag_0305 [Leptospirillum ferriphilum]OOH74369.1 hypothetical protein BOX24_01910 [Leptospirillum ferriphilum]